jgi:hypothetical protein
MYIHGEGIPRLMTSETGIVGDLQERSLDNIRQYSNSLSSTVTKIENSIPQRRSTHTEACLQEVLTVTEQETTKIFMSQNTNRQSLLHQRRDGRKASSPFNAGGHP